MKKHGLMRRIRNWLIVRIALAFGFVVPRVRLEALQRIGVALGSLGAWLPGKRKERVRRHLEIAFPTPEYSEEYRRSLLRPAYITTVQVFLEALWATKWNQERDGWRVEVEDEEKWQRTLAMARERGKGLVVYTAHLGSPEAASPWFASHLGMPMLSVASRPKIKELEGPMIAQRTAGGSQLVWRGNAGLATLRHLRGGGAVIMLVDHNLKGPGVGIPFFGKEAHTLLAPARLALQSGAVANTVFALRGDRGRFVLRCGEPMIMPAMEKDKERRFVQEAELAREYTRRIEDAVRQHPDQYLWMHKRWQERSNTLPYPSS